MKTFDAEKWVDKFIDIDVLETNIKKIVAEYKDIIEVKDNRQTFYIETVVSQHYGRYITRELAKIFEVNFKDYHKEFQSLVDETGRRARKIETEINERLSLKGKIHLGYYDADSSFGIFYILEKNF